MIARSHFDLVYIECKFGNPSNLSPSDLTHFLERATYLGAAIPILVIGYGGKLDSVVVDLLKNAYRGKNEEFYFMGKKESRRFIRAHFDSVYVAGLDNNGKPVEVLRDILDVNYRHLAHLRRLAGSDLEHLSSEYKVEQIPDET